jgi:hypothetical protein
MVESRQSINDIWYGHISPLMSHVSPLMIHVRALMVHGRSMLVQYCSLLGSHRPNIRY